jgi:hypothetical protein
MGVYVPMRDDDGVEASNGEGMCRPKDGRMLPPGTGAG